MLVIANFCDRISDLTFPVKKKKDFFIAAIEKNVSDSETPEPAFTGTGVSLYELSLQLLTPDLTEQTGAQMSSAFRGVFYSPCGSFVSALSPFFSSSVFKNSLTSPANGSLHSSSSPASLSVNSRTSSGSFAAMFSI